LRNGEDRIDRLSWIAGRVVASYAIQARRDPQCRALAQSRSCGKLQNLNTVHTAEKPMSATLEALQAEVLRLSSTDRARLLDRLIASLDVDSEAEAAWDALADQREAEIETGTVHPVDLDVAIARLKARFPG
jgi:hypothetical protein